MRLFALGGIPGPILFSAVVLISGTLNMGTGDKLDRSQTKSLHAGSVAVIQPKTNHFSWTREGRCMTWAL
jgi:hypothetical protein